MIGLDTAKYLSNANIMDDINCSPPYWTKLRNVSHANLVCTNIWQLKNAFEVSEALTKSASRLENRQSIVRDIFQETPKPCISMEVDSSSRWMKPPVENDTESLDLNSDNDRDESKENSDNEKNNKISKRSTHTKIENVKKMKKEKKKSKKNHRMNKK